MGAAWAALSEAVLLTRNFVSEEGFTHTISPMENTWIWPVKASCCEGAYTMVSAVTSTHLRLYLAP